MNRHLAIVSAAFTWTGVLLALPSLAALLYFGLALLGLRVASPAESAGGKSDYNSLVGLLVAGATAGGKVLNWFANGAQWAIALLAILSMLLLLVAVALFSIGRGLQTHQMWARILGITLASAIFFAATVSALSFRQGPTRAAFSAVAAMCAYILWALWRQFA